MAESDQVAERAHAEGGNSSQTPRPLRVMHVLAISLPYLNGYTVRSKYIVETQKQEGLDPLVVTSPFYPNVEAAIKDAEINGVTYRRIPHPLDVAGPVTFSDKVCRILRRILGVPGSGRSGASAPGVIGGANRLLDRRVEIAQSAGPAWRKYLRMAPFIVMYPFLMGIQWAGKTLRVSRSKTAPEGKLARWVWIVTTPLRWVLMLLRAVAKAIRNRLDAIEESLLLKRFERELIRIGGEVKADLIHAHSPYRCGIPALQAARQLGIPMVYEVRGLWEESSVATGRFRTSSWRYRSWKKKEAQIMSHADAVVAICEQLRQEVVERGAAADRIFIVPNAADPAIFHRGGEQPGDLPPLVANVRARLRPHTIGYVGSIRKLEGVDELVRAAAVLTRNGHDVSLLIVGDGPDLPGLKELAVQEGLGDRAVFTGRVPHDLVPHFYSLIDVFVISRPHLRVTELVTPLKPLEAMSMGKALVVSDLLSLREIVKENETGLVYTPGKPEDLAEKCATLLQDAALRQRLGQAAQKWIEQERTWSVVLRGLGPAYEAARRNSGFSAGS